MAGFLGTILLGNTTSVAVGDRTPLLLFCDIYIYLLAAFLISRVLLRDKAVVFDQSIILLSLLYLIANLVSTMVNGSDLYKAALSLKIFVNGIATYFVFLAICKNEADVDWAIKAMVSFGAMIGCLLIQKYLYGDQFTRLNKDMIELGWGRSNYLAAFLALLIPVGIGLVIANRRILQRLYFLACTALMLAAMVITMSRGAMLSLAVGLFIILPLTMNIRTTAKYFLALALVGVLFAYLVPILVPRSIIDLNFALLDQRLRSADHARINMYKAAMQDFLSNPLFGIGPLQSSVLASRFKSTPHNFILQMFAELGCFGGGSFLGLICIGFIRAYRNCSQRKQTIDYFLFAGLATTLLHGLVELTFQGAQYMIVFWILMAVFFARRRILETQVSPQPS